VLHCFLTRKRNLVISSGVVRLGSIGNKTGISWSLWMQRLVCAHGKVYWVLGT